MARNAIRLEWTFAQTCSQVLMISSARDNSASIRMHAKSHRFRYGLISQRVAERNPLLCHSDWKIEQFLHIPKCTCTTGEVLTKLKNHMFSDTTLDTTEVELPIGLLYPDPKMFCPLTIVPIYTCIFLLNTSEHFCQFKLCQARPTAQP
jgi:hypothetical protein